MKHFALHDALKPAMWAGVGIIACGVALVGLASTVGEAEQHDFFWDVQALEAEIDELEWADGIEAGVPYKWV